MNKNKNRTNISIVLLLISLLACNDNSVDSGYESSSSIGKNSSSEMVVSSSSRIEVSSSSSLVLNLSSSSITDANSSSSSLVSSTYREVEITEPTHVFDVRFEYQDTITGACINTLMCFGPQSAIFHIDSVELHDILNIKMNYVIDVDFIFDGLPFQNDNTTNYWGGRLNSMPDRFEMEVATEVDTVKIIYNKPNSYRFELVVFENDNIINQDLSLEENHNLIPTYNGTLDYKYLTKVKASSDAYYYIGYIAFESSPQFDAINREPVSEECKAAVAENCQGLSFSECYEKSICDPHIFEDRML